MIEIRNLSRHYGKNIALANISATIHKERITAFIGSNGTGKSTLLGSITDRQKPNGSGSIYIDGKNLNDYNNNELAKKISTLKQINHLNIRLRVRELVAFGRYPHSQGKINHIDIDYIDKALKHMELVHLQHKFLDQLSGGERQRAFIAMVVAQDTDYILLDEPLNNLDMKHSVEIMQMLTHLVRDHGKTVVIVLHDINFAAFYADYILALKNSTIYINTHKNDVIQADILANIFDMQFHITEIAGNRFSIYHG